MRRRYFILCLVGSIAMAALSCPAPAAAQTVRVSNVIWVGFGPLWLARDLGFFKKHGVDVEIVVNENIKEKYAMLASGTVDMLATSAGTSVLYMSRPDELQYIIGLDDSSGGDGVVATNAITSLADLKGKTIAVADGSLSEFYLLVLLKQAGLTESDVKLVDLDAPDAGEAFLGKKVDAAVTWEPWLSKAKATDFGHLLIDSTVSPGLLCDVLVTTREYAANHPKEVRAVVEGWNDAVAYVVSHREEAIEVMSRGMGGRLKDVEIFGETLGGTRLYGAEENKIFFGTRDKPGVLYETLTEAINAWSSIGRVRLKITPEDLMNYSFVSD
jgi:NitT/TauT family transport system substrate-binding protein